MQPSTAKLHLPDLDLEKMLTPLEMLLADLNIKFLNKNKMSSLLAKIAILKDLIDQAELKIQNAKILTGNCGIGRKYRSRISQTKSLYSSTKQY